MSRAKNELSRILVLVSEETDVPAEKILSKCSEMEIVDARWICARMLGELGFYPSRIAEMLGITPRYAQYILTDFEDRVAVSRGMRANYERIKKKYRSKAEASV